MKRYTALLLIFSLLLAGCAGTQTTEETIQPSTEVLVQTDPAVIPEPELSGPVTEIVFSGDTVTVDGAAAPEGEGPVHLSRDIVYYEARDTYESGNPYGEGDDWERHTPEEAAQHIVVNITQPGNYRISGTLTLGQVRIDLGEDAYSDPKAVVNLVLAGTDISCQVAPAILFQNVYECDGDWSIETAKAEVDTSAAGANIILEAGSENTVNGSHVARIYKDQEGEKKLWKQDGAIYSYMSMNVAGSGNLRINADNEGLDTELHLTINGGEIDISARNDGINTNEDGVSVTTINAGTLRILAGLGEEGDGIDSNGYLMINGGTVITSAHPAADAGLDSDMGSYIHGGTVIALGSTMDWAESDSNQVTMNLQFAAMQSDENAISVKDMQGEEVFAFDPSKDSLLSETTISYQGAIISCPAFTLGETYQVFVNGQQQAYTGTDVMRGPGGMGGRDPGTQTPEMPGAAPEKPEGDPLARPEGQMPTFPEGEIPTMPDGMDRPDAQTPPQGQDFPGGQEPPEGVDGEMPAMPEGDRAQGFQGNGGGFGGTSTSDASTEFYMQDKVNFFSGLYSIT